MEVKIPKEIRDYQESIFFGLSIRQFICSLLAVSVTIGLYFGLHPLISSEEVGWMCILGAAPFAACGFFKYHGMTAEKAAWPGLSRNCVSEKLVFKSDNLYYEALKDAIAEGEKLPRKKRKSQPPAGNEQ